MRRRPGTPNSRLLLGLKGAVFELGRANPSGGRWIDAPAEYGRRKTL